MARSLLAEEFDGRVVAEIISDELCAVTRRAAVLAEREMQNEGRGRPPCRYAVLVLGSGGRGESLLAVDQDNAIVYDKPGKMRGVFNAVSRSETTRLRDLLVELVEEPDALARANSGLEKTKVIAENGHHLCYF